MCLVASQGELLRGEQVRSRPEVVTNALRIAEGNLLRVAAYGFVDKGGRNNKVFRAWFRSVLEFPTEVARDSRLSSRAIHAFKVAQRVADALQTALRMLHPPKATGKGRESLPLDAATLAGFWQGLEPALSHAYLKALGERSPDAEMELKQWIRREAQRAFRNAAEPQRRTADGLFRIANAGNWFDRTLRQEMKKLARENHS